MKEKRRLIGLTALALTFLSMQLRTIGEAFNVDIPTWISFSFLGLMFAVLAILVFVVNRSDKVFQQYFIVYTLVFVVLIAVTLTQ